MPASHMLCSSQRVTSRRWKSACKPASAGLRLRARSSRGDSTGLTTFSRSSALLARGARATNPAIANTATSATSAKTSAAAIESIGLRLHAPKRPPVELEPGGFDPGRVSRADSGRAKGAQDLARRADAARHELEQVLHHHHFTFHPADLGDPGDLARAIGVAV